MLMFTLPAKAGVVTQMVIPFDTIVVIDCDQDGIPEDVVELSGNLYILETTTSNGTVTTMKELFVPRELTGTGLITGATYRGVGNTQSTSTQFNSGSFTVFTFVNNFYIIGQGSGYRYLVHETAHITVDSSGNVIADVDNAFITCPGF